MTEQQNDTESIIPYLILLGGVIMMILFAWAVFEIFDTGYILK